MLIVPLSYHFEHQQNITTGFIIYPGILCAIQRMLRACMKF